MSAWELRVRAGGHGEAGTLVVAMTGLAALVGLLAALAVVGYAAMNQDPTPWESDSMFVVVPIAIAAVLIPFGLFLLHHREIPAHTVRITTESVQTVSRSGEDIRPLTELRAVTVHHSFVSHLPRWTHLALHFETCNVRTRQFPYRAGLAAELTAVLKECQVTVTEAVSETNPG
ncbi:hypothetical protein [Crossiella cryophila]|uniref:PH domain-containing protein n=1 Tax=Crossiella cryophila TaxID=43355 RepID=A0A7W7CFV4_9PSEU|nr:hypothetical protein [Crossiella cryophila]MBB4680456.1 hypothetical protein [Crossiella cryophila]